MPLRLSDNFYDPKNALRKRENAKIWQMLASGLKVKFQSYYGSDESPDTYWIGQYELPTIFNLLTETDPVCHIQDTRLTLTDKGSNLLREIIKQYDGKFTIVNAMLGKRGDDNGHGRGQPKAFLKGAEDKSVHSRWGYGETTDPILYVRVQQLVKNKQTDIIYGFDLTRRICDCDEEGFMRYAALNKKVIEEINTYLTEEMKADMAEKMLDTQKGYYIRDYLVA